MSGSGWPAAAAATGLRIFPIRIYFEGGKWHKKPLVKNWVNEAHRKPDRFDWTSANGYGIATGGDEYGRDVIYAFDLDSYKAGCEGDDWLAAHRLDFPTRTHRTVSGGLHRIYRLPDACSDLRSTANIAPGLDSRGAGGFIAFGEGYSVMDDRAPAGMPQAAIDAVRAHSVATGAAGEAEVDIGSIIVPAVVSDALRARLRQLWDAYPTFRKRWNGSMRDGGPKDASSLDMSVAWYLGQWGLETGEIVLVLEQLFPNGQARGRYAGSPVARRRAASRCAAKATAVREQREAVALRIMRARPDNEPSHADVMRILGLTK